MRSVSLFARGIIGFIGFGWSKTVQSDRFGNSLQDIFEKLALFWVFIYSREIGGIEWVVLAHIVAF